MRYVIADCLGTPGGGGVRLGLDWPVCVCPNVKEMGSFQPQVNDMNEKMSFKMGIKFAASFYMGKKEGVIQNGSIFKSRTHTPGHFDNGVAPPGGLLSLKKGTNCGPTF